jgi:hypothetical protein
MTCSRGADEQARNGAACGRLTMVKAGRKQQVSKRVRNLPAKKCAAVQKKTRKKNLFTKLRT